MEVLNIILTMFAGIGIICTAYIIYYFRSESKKLKKKIQPMNSDNILKVTSGYRTVEENEKLKKKVDITKKLFREKSLVIYEHNYQHILKPIIYISFDGTLRYEDKHQGGVINGLDKMPDEIVKHHNLPTYSDIPVFSFEITNEK